MPNPAPMARTKTRLLKADTWAALLRFMVVGYLAMGRSFAYLGLPPAKLFIGEIVLGAFLLSNFNAITLLRPQLGRRALERLANDYRLPLFIFVTYGLFCLTWGMVNRYPILPAVQCFAFNYYAVYLLLGIWAGVWYPLGLARLIRIVAVVNGVYGCVYVALLNSSAATIPGSPGVPLFGPPCGSAVAILGLLALPPAERRKWVMNLMLVLNLLTLAGMQVRAEWLGFVLGVVTLAALHRPSRKPITRFFLIVVLIGGLSYIADLRVPAPASRGGEISVRGIIGRSLATVSPELGGEYVDNAEDFGGTVDWRKIWWGEIWKSINYSRDDAIFFFGHGYGFQLTDLVSYIDAEGGFAHAAQCIFLHPGVWRMVWHRGAFPVPGRSDVEPVARLAAGGQSLWIGLLDHHALGAFFSNYLENPFGAVPFYVIIGMSIAPVIARKSVEVRREENLENGNGSALSIVNLEGADNG